MNMVFQYITAFNQLKIIKNILNSIINQTWFKNNNNYEIILGIMD